MEFAASDEVIDTATLIATASNDWVRESLPPRPREGERFLLWPLPSDVEHPSDWE